MEIGMNSSGMVEIPSISLATAGTAILAMRGAGKSWLTAVLAEGFSKERIPYVIVDSEGEYWTLRVKFSDVIIAGGSHADVPLELNLAEPMADAAVDDRLEMVLDLSDFRRAQQMELLTRFLNQLFVRETGARTPLWVCLEEADLWIPQSGNPLTKTHVLDLCQRGRKRGLGFALVSQRPAVLDKTALSQAEFRFFKRFNQPHDLRAVTEYLAPHSRYVDLLPSFSPDEALLYAPTLHEEPVRFRVSNRLTPHGGATPQQIATIKPTASTLKLRRKLESLLQVRKQELSEIQRRDQAIALLQSRIEVLQEELAKAKLAAHVADLLVGSSTSGPSHSTKNHSDSDKTGQKPDTVQGTAGAEEQLAAYPTPSSSNQQSIELGPIGIDIRTGIVSGSSLADILLNRLGLEERVVFLAMVGSGGPMSVTQVSTVTGRPLGRVRTVIKQLARRRLIRKTGRSRHGDLFLPIRQ